MFRTLNILFVTSIFLFVVSSCGDSDPIDPPTDFREQWVGTYEGTKSNIGFDDTLFTTEITFDVTIDEDSEDGLIVNGINFPISDEGTFGPEFLEGGFTNYTLTIVDNELRLESFLSNIPGIAIPCFIIATIN